MASTVHRDRARGAFAEARGLRLTWAALSTGAFWNAALTLLAVDLTVWLAVHLGTGYLAHRVPPERLADDGLLFRERRWEDGGRAYRRHLRIERWKRLLPEAGEAFEGGFDKSRMRSTQTAYLERYVVETRRAELSHLLAMAPAPAFLAWNPPWLGWPMVAYALVFNVPPIASQRYNRLRLQRILARRARRASSVRNRL